MHRVSAAVGQYADLMQFGTSGIPGKAVPAHFSWTAVLGQGRVQTGGIWSGWRGAQARSSSRVLGFPNPLEEGGITWPLSGLLLTDLLLVVGGLAPSHALPEGTGSHRKGLLSPEPGAAVWAGSCHVRPCGSSWAGRCSGCSFELK